MHPLARLAGIAALLTSPCAFAADAVPDCAATEGVQVLACGDPELADDERMLDSVLDDARRKAGAGLATLEAEQRAWLASRERCLSEAQPWTCVWDDTVRRTAVLQARFRLVDSRLATFACDPAGHDLLQLELFATGPFTQVAIARRGGSQAMLWIAPSADGSRYVGPAIEVWLAEGHALVRWGKDAEEITCRPS
jgi:uncharacterized protein YecT (DUF1311 family)